MNEDIENPKYKTFGVNLFCVRADWILKDDDPHGMQFLKTMLAKRNRDVFMTPYMKIIIQFLYEAYSAKIKLLLLPPYLAHLLAANLQIYGNESDRALKLEKFLLQAGGEDETSMKIKTLDKQSAQAVILSNVLVNICFIINCLNMVVFFL